MRRIAVFIALPVLAIGVFLWLLGEDESDTALSDVIRGGSESEETSSASIAIETSDVPAIRVTETRSSIDSLLDDSVSQGDALESRIRHWAESPATVEASILAELESGRYGVFWDPEIACTETSCEIHLTRNRPGSFWLLLTDSLRETIDASGVGTRWDENPDGSVTYTITASTARESPPDDYRGRLGLSAEELRRFGERFVSPDDPYAEPFKDQNTEEFVMVEEK